MVLRSWAAMSARTSRPGSGQAERSRIRSGVFQSGSAAVHAGADLHTV
ncbi:MULTISPECIES: hypothetical protein [Thermomonosporaceae]|nr:MULTISPECIES: hypothetical protein [Thermomonosporaceae]MDL4776768.1 hypothetical protein [Actinomadura xylanilytica]